MDSSPHERHVVRQVGIDDIAERLAGLRAPDLRTLLLDVADRRARSLTPAEVLRRYEGTRTFHPSSVNPGAYRRFQAAAMGALPPGFEELVLAPEAPFGASSALGGMSQDRVVTTMSGSEVVSDSTNVLALECARRRRDRTVRRWSEVTRLAASHRLLRPRNGAHFGLLALCTAGRDRGSFTMQLEALREHLTWHVGVIIHHAPGLDLRASLTDLTGGIHRDALSRQLLDPLRVTHPGVAWGFDDKRIKGSGYYTGVCFAIDAVSPDGATSNLSDGGFTEWTARLLADRKERLLISGLGSERLINPGVAAS